VVAFRLVAAFRLVTAVLHWASGVQQQGATKLVGRILPLSHQV